MRYRSYPIVLLVIFMLTGCLSPVQTDPDSTYMLDTLPNHISKSKTRNITLLVQQPDTRPIYNTTKMAYTIKPYQVSYFGRNQWAETPSQMLLPLMVQTLQNTNHFRAVVTPPFTGRYHYLLTTQILQLQQNFLKCPNVVEVTIRVQLSKASSNQVIGTKEITVRVPIKQRSPYCGVIAANKAMALALADIDNFCLQRIDSDR
jgi:cholesterol transport system auxiliary component